MINVTTVWDAGTELEDFEFSTGNPLFSGLPDPDTAGGTDQNGVIAMVTSTDPFSLFANNISLDTNAFNFSGLEVGRITLTVVPEPASIMFLGLGALGLVARRTRQI